MTGQTPFDERTSSSGNQQNAQQQSTTKGDRSQTSDAIEQSATTEGLIMNDDDMRKTPGALPTESMLVDVDAPLYDNEEPRYPNNAPKSSLTSINTHDDDTGTRAIQTGR
jgi:hypothetical protein